VRYSGLLTRLLWQKGDLEQAASAVVARSQAQAPGDVAHGLIDPVPGMAYTLSEA
jgi:hypothetical protein